MVDRELRYYRTLLFYPTPGVLHLRLESAQYEMAIKCKQVVPSGPVVRGNNLFGGAPGWRALLSCFRSALDRVPGGFVLLLKKEVGSDCQGRHPAASLFFDCKEEERGGCCLREMDIL